MVPIKAGCSLANANTQITHCFHNQPALVMEDFLGSTKKTLYKTGQHVQWETFFLMYFGMFVYM